MEAKKSTAGQKEARQQKPPAAYSKKGAQRAKQNPDKDANPVSIGAIVSVFLILMIVSVLALIYFDLLGAKDLTVELMNLDQPTNNYMKELIRMEEEILDVQADMQEAEKELEKTRKELDNREKQIVAQEEELAARQEALIQMQTLVEGLQTDIGALALMMEQMDPQAAADALGMLYSTTDIARVLSAMDGSRAAKILDKMQTDRAALVIAEMLRYTS